jgi:tol-pal system protein YbgF
MMLFAKSTYRRGLLLAPIACVILSGCVATKSDVRLLRSDIAALQTRQDSLYRESLGQMSAQADSVRMLSETLRLVRGQLSNQIRQLSDMLVTVQELMGTNAQTVRQLREQLERQQAAPPPQTAPSQPNGPDAETLYSLGRTKLEERSAAAARAAFQNFLEQYPQHERAPDAQIAIGESYVMDDDLEEAVAAFEKVSSAYPTSARAPESLYRAGQISEQRKRTSDARRFYNLVVTRYADSPSARLARQRLTALR